MILEGIITTTNPDGSANIAPMGPKVDADLTRFTLRPYQTATTFQNLVRTRVGVLHVTDDVELFARAAINRLDCRPGMRRTTTVDGWILTDACRWYAFEVRSIDMSEPRTQMEAEVIDHGRQRDFFGFNRAKHAVLEAAILATRVEFLPAAEVHAEFDRLATIVDKTAGPAEHRAFALLQDYVVRAYDNTARALVETAPGRTGRLPAAVPRGDISESPGATVPHP